MAAALAWGQALPAGKGRKIIQTACVQCHALSLITNSGHTREQWEDVLEVMLAVGARVPRTQLESVLAYLAKNFPEKPAQLSSLRKSAASSLVAARLPPKRTAL